MARILVTGAAGFIGQALCPVLVASGHEIVGTLRHPGPAPAGVVPLIVGEIGPQTQWSAALRGVEVVIHLAARAHRGGAGAALAREPAAAAALGRAAARAGAHRIVLLSSIKAMGEATLPDRPFRPDDPPLPADAYGRAKLATERAVARAAEADGIEYAILRPPLVYGPGVKANFRALIRLAASGLPLPLAGIDNRRSLLFIGNLVDLVAAAAMHPAAGGRILLARDAEELSTPGLIRVLANALGRQGRMFALPSWALAALRRLPLAGPPMARLSLSLRLDDSTTRAMLGWAPPFAASPALAATARAVAGNKPVRCELARPD
ncbi:MAG: NAD-dependent epimerase/dehydratase family protein [Alphaproteobacteria bacterium]|nr:NAD-dependent epimerase/dehydratase family protein [Alphaproteobacteria bacterium]